MTKYFTTRSNAARAMKKAMTGYEAFVDASAVEFNDDFENGGHYGHIVVKSGGGNQLVEYFEERGMAAELAVGENSACAAEPAPAIVTEPATVTPNEVNTMNDNVANTAADDEAAAAKAAAAQAKADAKAAKEAEKAQKAQERAEAKAAKEAAKAEKAEAAKRVSQNGITQPLPGSISGVLWAVYDEVSQAKGGPAALSEVMEPALATGNKKPTITSAYAHWRKFYGITGRIESDADRAARETKAQEKAAKAEAAAAAKAAKAQADAEAAAAKQAAAQTEPAAE